MKKKPFLIVTLTAMLMLILAQSVFAFSDTAGTPEEKKIASLKEKGIISGYSDNTFKPNGKLTYAAGVSMIVKGLDLNIDNLRFIKEPKATDYFPELNDNAWYADDFIIAFHNGLDIPKDVKASDKMTKEQFAHHLFNAMMTKGDFAFIEIFMMINDEADVNPAYMNSIQKLLISKIAVLDDENNFYPQQHITRGTAAAWLHDGIEFVETMTPIDSEPETELPAYKLDMDVTPVNDDVNQVTITAEMPHPGYGLRVASISFQGDEAHIELAPILPDPDRMYPQVITEVSVTTYIGSEYTPVLPKAVEDMDMSTDVEPTDPVVNAS
ncbi:S-layer homology domain-containing protein [Paenibacillus sp. J5C2022]|uniref:S-layer homology domain-containing protein n=1 Tax=Paenibacillus sp. J5C2022 TaxID=2977129 RepID=UPI0021CDFA5F|nr:S-layer homology domain-containing protein [Paenibacillus sp. J5C2022]